MMAASLSLSLSLAAVAATYPIARQDCTSTSMFR
jgi:hypothetical protein